MWPSYESLQVDIKFHNILELSPKPSEIDHDFQRYICGDMYTLCTSMLYLLERDAHFPSNHQITPTLQTTMNEFPIDIMPCMGKACGAEAMRGKFSHENVSYIYPTRKLDPL